MNIEEYKNNDCRVVIINGSGGCGKDTFVECVKSYLGDSVRNISSVDKIKEFANYIDSVNPVGAERKDESYRAFVAILKDVCDVYNQYPNRYVLQRIYSELEDGNPKLIFVHIREPKNIEITVKNTEAITLLIRNPNVPVIVSNESDKNVENYNYDYIIENDGTVEDLKEKARDFLVKLNLL